MWCAASSLPKPAGLSRPERTSKTCAVKYERGEKPRLGERLLHKYNPIIRRIRHTPKPIIGAINGIAAGIAYACDRVASEYAKFMEAFIRVGLAPDSGTGFFLPRLVGLAKALELSMTNVM